VMLENLNKEQVAEVIDKFVFPNNVKARVLSYKENESKVRRKLAAPMRLLPSEIYKSLEPLSHEVTICIMAKTRSPLARKRIKRFFTDYNGVQLAIHGHDIQKEGVAPGPEYKDILKQVLYEKLDGHLPARRDEIRYMKRVIKELP